MWKKITVIAAITALGGFAVAGVLRCGRTTYRLERSATIAAPPDTLQPLLANLQLWTTWSPWERADPTLQRIYGGPDSGAGANYFWSGGDEVGTGRMSVVAASAAEVRVRMEIEKPRRRTSDFEFRLVAQDKGTRVTWIAVCENDRAGTLQELLESPAPARALELEAGLRKLKEVAEAAAAVEKYKVERSATLNASPATVLAKITTLREWTDWFPREALDRTMQERYLGHGNAVGATYYWTGNDVVGAGRATLLAANASKVEVEVELYKPAKSLSDYEFAIVPDGNGTRLTWTISGEKDASGKAFGFFAVPLDEMGSDMEKALASLGSAIEADSKLATK
ncbi:MAG: SRPBCC family protein [Myxococcales bacterium]